MPKLDTLVTNSYKYGSILVKYQFFIAFFRFPRFFCFSPKVTSSISIFKKDIVFFQFTEKPPHPNWYVCGQTIIMCSTPIIYKVSDLVVTIYYFYLWSWCKPDRTSSSCDCTAFLRRASTDACCEIWNSFVWRKQISTVTFCKTLIMLSMKTNQFKTNIFLVPCFS